ncbi:MAG: hypothetical protein UT32_C0021G0005 [Parcubacteria group bacterium GW2011_GWC2_39_14]|nr:MAG: hypothetical protein UT32_C0021G0005 [Parcubacteria group bacterium GW2011_GWC2_39_14]KKR53938.1 MAG: hypothetical protein UT91_C0022G0005 [Parcubacteria group bacterium GW2011_GWA2_40_23]
MDDKHFLQKAIEKARESLAQGGFPAGAIIVKEGKIIGEGVSLGYKVNDPTGHGEIVSIRMACANLKTADLSGAIFYTSMQPCLMCLGASVWSNISRIVFACAKDRVVDDYYGGHYDPAQINLELSRPIEMVHMKEFEEESLSVVREWEKNNHL